MEQEQKIELETLLNQKTDLKALQNWPGNIRRFPGNNGSLFVAVDQNGNAIAMAFVPNS